MDKIKKQQNGSMKLFEEKEVRSQWDEVLTVRSPAPSTLPML